MSNLIEIITRVKFYLKKVFSVFIKLLQGVIFIYGIFLLISMAAEKFFYTPSVENYQSFLRDIISSSIGIPGKKLDHVINNHPDIEEVSEKEWNELECDFKEKCKIYHTSYDPNDLYLDYKDPYLRACPKSWIFV